MAQFTKTSFQLVQSIYSFGTLPSSEPILHGSFHAKDSGNFLALSSIYLQQVPWTLCFLNI